MSRADLSSALASVGIGVVPQSGFYGSMWLVRQLALYLQTCRRRLRTPQAALTNRATLHIEGQIDDAAGFHHVRVGSLSHALLQRSQAGFDIYDLFILHARHKSNFLIEFALPLTWLAWTSKANGSTDSVLEQTVGGTEDDALSSAT